MLILLLLLYKPILLINPYFIVSIFFWQSHNPFWLKTPYDEFNNPLRKKILIYLLGFFTKKKTIEVARCWKRRIFNQDQLKLRIWTVSIVCFERCFEKKTRKDGLKQMSRVYLFWKVFWKENEEGWIKADVKSLFVLKGVLKRKRGRMD